MKRKIDPESVKKLREAVEMIPPQKSPRAAKSLNDLKTAVERMEREATKGSK